ncbi:MAG: peroxiredoxin family protein [Akkermansiaceae bacterium]
MFRILILFVSIATLQVHASPTEAERIKRTYELSAETWALKLKLAQTPAEKQALWDKRPDAKKTAADTWRLIGPSLAQDWTIPYATFFLTLTRNLVTTDSRGIATPDFIPQRERIIEVFSKNHLQKPGIGAFAIALAESGDPQAIGTLEKIINTNPDNVTKGVAALGASMLLKNLGDATEVMKKRLKYLRLAIIHAADQTIGDTSIADIASDELFVIRYLSKGRQAPDFSGTDVASRVIRLSNFKGKITLVLFWDAKTTETDKVIQLTNQMVDKYLDKPVQILGITPESLTRIRELQADGSIKWNNIIDPAEKISGEYKVANRPLVIILDEKGTIQYTGLPGSFAELTVDALLAGEAPK